jgi:hypothetical protein
MWKKVSWPDFIYYSIIVLHNKYWVLFSVGPFAMLMSPTQLLSLIRYKLTGLFPNTVTTVYYVIYLEEVRKNTEDLSQDLVSEPEFNLAPLKYAARVELTSEHDMQ